MPRVILSNLSNFEVKRVCTAPALAVRCNAKKTSKMPIEKEILERFILNNPELDRLEGMLSDFNLFETLNLVNVEIRHSNVLSWLLNPNENHGLNTYFLNIFLKRFISDNKTVIEALNVFDIEMLNYNDVEIRREWKNIDILIIIKESDKNIVIAIENKIKSTEHSNQLERYREIVEKEFANFHRLYVFLTPENTIPTDESWNNLSYSTVSELIENIILHKRDLLNENILNFIEHFNIILKRYLVGNSEIEIICKQIYKKHKDALDLIFQYKPDIASDISDVVQSLILNNQNLILDSAGKTVIRFTTETIEKNIPNISEGWLKSKRLFVYEFYNYDSRLALRLYIGPGEKLFREDLYNYLSMKRELFSLTSRTLSKKWHCVYQKEFLKKKDFEEKDFEELENLVKTKWSEFVREDLTEIDSYVERRHST